MECERCGKEVRSQVALHDHLKALPENGGCPNKRRRATGIIMETDRGPIQVEPKSPRDMYMEP